MTIKKIKKDIKKVEKAIENGEITAEEVANAPIIDETTEVVEKQPRFVETGTIINGKKEYKDTLNGTTFIEN